MDEDAFDELSGGARSEDEVSEEASEAEEYGMTVTQAMPSQCLDDLDGMMDSPKAKMSTSIAEIEPSEVASMQRSLTVRSHMILTPTVASTPSSMATLKRQRTSSVVNFPELSSNSLAYLNTSYSMFSEMGSEKMMLWCEMKASKNPLPGQEAENSPLVRLKNGSSVSVSLELPKGFDIDENPGPEKFTWNSDENSVSFILKYSRARAIGLVETPVASTEEDTSFYNGIYLSDESDAKSLQPKSAFKLSLQSDEDSSPRAVLHIGHEDELLSGGSTTASGGGGDGDDGDDGNDNDGDDDKDTGDEENGKKMDKSSGFDSEKKQSHKDEMSSTESRKRPRDTDNGNTNLDERKEELNQPTEEKNSHTISKEIVVSEVKVEAISSNMKTCEVLPEEPGNATAPVWFSIFTPEVEVGSDFIVSGWVHAPEELEEIKKVESAEGRNRSHSKQGLLIPGGVEIAMNVEKYSNCLEPVQDEDSVPTWDGRKTNMNFIFSSSEKLGSKGCFVVLQISANGKSFGKLPAVINVQKTDLKPPQQVHLYPSKTPHVFISYRRTFGDLALCIKTILEMSFGYTVFLDNSPDCGLTAGDFQKQLEENLSQAVVFIPVFTPAPSGEDPRRKLLSYLGCVKNSVESKQVDWCYVELQEALKMYREDQKIIIPVFKNVDIGGEYRNLPDDINDLGKLNSIHIVDGYFKEAIQRVHKGIQDSLLRREKLGL